MPADLTRSALVMLITAGVVLAVGACGNSVPPGHAAAATAPRTPAAGTPAARVLAVTSTSPPASVTASPTPSPTASPTPSPTPEPTQTNTPTPAPADTATPAPAPTPSPPPARLIIPRIGVDAPVAPLGEDATGAMASPDSPRVVGWWDEGTAPGDLGSAVLDGHVDFANYGAAVFWNLHLLMPGDSVQVVSTVGQVLTFTVSEVTTFDAADNSNIDEIYRRDDQPRLNLITCAGTFNPRTHNYDKRIVVFTTLATN